MKILITGATGFVGRSLVQHLLHKGHTIIGIGRSSSGLPINNSNWRYIQADTTQSGAWLKEIPDADVIINLAGQSIFKRWTKSYKKQLFDSRILTTRNIVNNLPEDKPVTLLNASAIGIYGPQGNTHITEDNPIGTGFLAELGQAWEAEAFKAQAKTTRVVAMRFGIVLGAGGGALEQMLPPFKYFIGGPMGNGKQWFSWIHIEDLCHAVFSLIEQKHIKGPVNLCAPNPIQNKTLAKAIGHALNRPAFFKTPVWLLRLALGEFGSVLLESQRVLPQRLIDADFQFQYPNIRSALKNLIA
jgi:uncharacterized protein